MKLDQDDRLEEGIFSQSRECSAESLAPPEIVGEVANPVLEASVASRGERWIVSVIGLWLYGCRSATGSTDQNRRHPPT